MKRVMPDFEGWAVFAQVARRRSFAGAADDLGLSAGTVSKAVGRLERRLGVTLFHRTTRSLSLTPAGRTLVDRAEKLLSDGEEAEDVARDEGALPRGLVRIAAPHSYGVAHLAPLLPDLLRALPEIRIELDLDDGPTDLIGGGVDLALRIGWLPDSRLRARKLATISAFLVAAPAYVASHAALLSPSDLARHRTLAYANVAPPDRWLLRHRDGHEERAALSNLLVVNSGEAMLPLLREGMAVAVLPDFLAAADLATGTLVRVLADWSFPDAGLYLVTPATGPRPRRVVAVVDFLAERLASLNASGER